MYFEDIAYEDIKKGNFEDAIEKFESLIRNNRSVAFSYNGIGEAKYHLGDILGALKYFDESIKCSAPIIRSQLHTYAKPFYNKGLCYQKFKNYSDAISNYSKAIDIANKQSGCTYLNYSDKRGHQVIPQAYVARAEAQLCLDQSLKRKLLAIEDYTKATSSSNGSNQKVFIKMGKLKNEIGKYESAIEDFTKADKYVNSYGIALTNKAYSKNMLGQYESAIKDCNKAIEQINQYLILYGSSNNEVWNSLNYSKEEIKTSQKNAYLYRGTAYKKLNKHKEAANDFERVYELDNNCEYKKNETKDKSEFDKVLEKEDEKVKELDRIIKLYESEIKNFKETNEFLKNKHFQELREKYEIIKQKDKIIEGKDETMKQKDETIKMFDEIINKQHKKIEELEKKKRGKNIFKRCILKRNNETKDKGGRVLFNNM